MIPELTVFVYFDARRGGLLALRSCGTLRVWFFAGHGDLSGDCWQQLVSRASQTTGSNYNNGAFQG